ncbi:MAG: TolC family protein [Nitrospirae bacterium]|nr:TolC family protein [Nitrospirota bacterium]
MIRRCKKYILLIISITFLFTQHTLAEEKGIDVDLSKELSLEECVNLALKNHPTLKASSASVEASKSQIWESRYGYFPQINLSSGYSESNSTSATYGETVTKSYLTTLSLSQKIYDFEKTGSAVDSAKANMKATEMELDKVKSDIILKVKESYFGLLQSQRMVGVNEVTVNQAKAHLRRAKAFFEVGTRPKFDVTQAEVELNNANLNFQKARHSFSIAKITLSNSMGLPPDREIKIKDLFFAERLYPVIDDAVKEAIDARPDVKQIDSKIEGGKASVRTAIAGYLPTISSSASYSWQNGDYIIKDTSTESPLENYWSWGVTVTLPIFEGFLTTAKVSTARANLMNLRYQKENLQQNVMLEVQQAYLNLEDAKTRISVMESSLQKAKENFAIAEGRYNAGVSSLIEVTDAQTALTKAETDHVQAFYDYHTAAARLDKALGR